MTQNRMQKVVTKTKMLKTLTQMKLQKNDVEERDWKPSRPQQQRNKPKHYQEE